MGKYKSRKMRGGMLSPFTQGEYTSGDGIGATQYGASIHNEDGSIKGGGCGGSCGGVASTTGIDTSSPYSLYGGRSRKNKQYKIPGLLFLDSITKPTKRRYCKNKKSKKITNNRKTAKK